MKRDNPRQIAFEAYVRAVHELKLARIYASFKHRKLSLSTEKRFTKKLNDKEAIWQALQ